MKLDCSQFQDDFDVLRQFPFPIEFLPPGFGWPNSVAVMNSQQTGVRHIQISNEKVIPWSLFCLSNLQDLTIKQTPFENGKNVSSDHFENLSSLDWKTLYLMHWQI